MGILIGLVGKPNSGRDTVGNCLKSKYGFYKYSFSDYLKWLVHDYFLIDSSNLWGEKTKKSRWLLQNLGNILTDIDTNIFIDKVESKIKKDYMLCESKKNFNAVITDVKKSDELKLFDKFGPRFLISHAISDSGVHVKNIFSKISVVLMYPCKDIITSYDGECSDVDSKHTGEALYNAIQEWDYLLGNRGSLDDLYSNIETMIFELTKEN
ncbi:hypothetical protein COV24_03395 [candidate division WWE3 bacterium CG10_big_fil_rev_8_21_14_0_10_32_10]|uniref:Uncharacterized protein n=1 Tax=candidate division WWE3 bacterium CG10_big_fil_rev_8_21_14_0_10_32_10 TaxID=1975090 RepID=A0A2H0R9X6_UNCKA|nr:MAG: hypothetical protein COV24_03395 [candidate division WWE3 bacterium CG10_big_fil_rev_8_21_14_0_10_32_10]